MIFIHDEFMEPERLFRKGAFTKRGDSYYFTAEQVSDDSYLTVKLEPKFSERRFEIEVVNVFVTNDNEESILSESIEIDKKEREYALDRMFHSLSYTDSVQDIMIFEAMVEFIKEYLEDAYFYSENGTLYGEFMRLFQVKGTIAEGNYGSIRLIDISIINRSTGDVIKKFDDVYIDGSLYFEEDDDVESVLEAFGDSMSEYDIKEIFLPIIKQGFSI